MSLHDDKFDEVHNSLKSHIWTKLEIFTVWKSFNTLTLPLQCPTTIQKVKKNLKYQSCLPENLRF